MTLNQLISMFLYLSKSLFFVPHYGLQFSLYMSFIYFFLDFIHILNCFVVVLLSSLIDIILSKLEIYSFLHHSLYLTSDYYILELHPLYFLLPKINNNF